MSTGWKYRASVVSMASLLIVVAACRRQAASARNPFPQNGEVAGWTTTGEPRTFAAANLSDYIDGDAEKYLKAGVQSVSTADYKLGDQTQATVDVYTMASADGAKTIFESEPAVNAKSAPVGDAAGLYEQSLVYRKGPYLVRIVAYQTSPQLEQAMVQLGKGIEGKLSQ